MKSHVSLLALLCAVGAIGCQSSLDGGSRRVVGLIDASGTGFDPLVLPDTAHTGVSFSVTVSTFGSSCLRADGAEANVSGSTASITPYDLEPPSGSICTADFRAFPRDVMLTFLEPGVAVVRLHGRGFRTPELTVEKSVVVKP